jgi:hypothetical protein
MIAPYTIFGKTRNVEVRVFQRGKEIQSDTWDIEIWIERGEDWYGLEGYGNKKVRVIEREAWIKAQ